MDERMYPTAKEGRAPDGLRMRAGVVTLDGSNPTVVNTGLKSVVAASATIAGSGAPGLDPSLVTVGIGADGVLNIYAWKPTASGNATLIASTDNARQVHWTAFGT